MDIIKIITKKVENKELTSEELAFFINGYLKNEIKDYQASSLLMAILLNGMTANETKNFTNLMMNSGEIINLDGIQGTIVDKHSTGGVGDKISLILAPIVASLGGKIAKMSGRGLSFTGGTIDKLETIPGFTTELPTKQFIENVNKYGLSIISQSQNITPADKKLYALRDVTGTVRSMPLIISSIMSKKLATGSDAILLDVKCGNGAFMKNLEDAEKLAINMISIGKSFNKDVRAYISDMSVPLGRAIGNKIEVIEAIETLEGNGPADVHELATNLAATSLVQGNIFKTKREALINIEKTIKSGAALNKFYEFVKAQNGDVEKLKSPLFLNPKYKYEIKAQKNGYMKILSALNFGLITMHLGAGRQSKNDVIDAEAGIYLNKKTGENVKKGEIIIILYSSTKISKNLIKQVNENYKIIKKQEKKSIIIKELG